LRFQVKIWFQNRRMKWKRSKKSFTTNQKAPEGQTDQSASRDDGSLDLNEAELAEMDDDSDIDISDDPDVDIEQSGERDVHFNEDEYKDRLNTCSSSLDLSLRRFELRENAIQGPFSHSQTFAVDNKLMNHTTVA